MKKFAVIALMAIAGMFALAGPALARDVALNVFVGKSVKHSPWAFYMWKGCLFKYLPKITIAEQPQHGKIEIVPAKFTPLHSECKDKVINGLQVVYTPNPDIKVRTTDTFSLLVEYLPQAPDGWDSLHDFTVKILPAVATAPAGG